MHVTALSRPLFKYFGSKWQTAKHHPAPIYDTIIEPFAGSACYACHYPEREVILFDKDPDVVALWQWLISADPAEIMSLPVESLVQGQDLRELGLSDGSALLIRHWQRSCSTQSWTVSSRNNKSGQWDRSAQRQVAANVQRIRHWNAFCVPFEELPDCQATWFCDPPYQHVHGYKHTRKAIDFQQLAHFCATRSGQVVVCEQQGADWLPFEHFRTIAAKTKERMSGEKMARDLEVLWHRT